MNKFFKKIKKERTLLSLILLFILIFNLYFAFQTPYFTSDASYFHLKQAEHIKNHFMPLMNDPLTNGNIINDPMLFHYILAPFTLSPLLLKLFSVILILLTPLSIYYFSKKLTNKNYFAALSAIIFTLTPIFLRYTLNQLTPYVLVIPITLAILSIILNIEHHLNYFLIFSFILPLIHPAAIIITLTLIFYWISVYTEAIEISNTEKESIAFFIFLTLLIAFIFFKQSMLNQGVSLLYQYNVSELLKSSLDYFTISEVVHQINIIPLFFGILGIGLSIKSKNKIFILTNSLVIAILFMLITGLIQLEVGLLFLTAALSVLATYGFEKTYSYLERTKLPSLKTYFNIILNIIILALVIIPAYPSASKIIEIDTISLGEYEAFKWLEEHTNPDSKVLASPIEGDYITHISKRKNIIHTHVSSLRNPEKLFSDIETVYTSYFETEALKNLNEYQVDFFYVSKRGKQFYNQGEIKYLENEDCFQKRYSNDRAEIFKLVC